MIITTSTAVESEASSLRTILYSCGSRLRVRSLYENICVGRVEVYNVSSRIYKTETTLHDAVTGVTLH